MNKDFILDQRRRGESRGEKSYARDEWIEERDKQEQPNCDFIYSSGYS